MDELHGMSSAAHRVAKAAQSARAAYEVRAERSARKMLRGPYLDATSTPGVTLIAWPSEPGWFKPPAKAWLRATGFRWDGEGHEWLRPAHDYRGRRYTPEAWLASCRRKFFSFWPQLARWLEEHPDEDISD